MINSNPFQSPEQQLNDLMSESWDKFNETTEAINEANKKANKAKEDDTSSVSPAPDSISNFKDEERLEP